MSGTYVSYKHFKLGYYYFKPPQYVLPEDLLSRLTSLEKKLKDNEKAKYKELFQIQRLSPNWKEDFKDYLGQGYEYYSESKAFNALSSAWDIVIEGIKTASTPQQRGANKRKFTERLMLDLEEINRGEDQLFPIREEDVRKVGGIIFNSLCTYYENKRFKVTKTGIEFHKNSKQQRNFIGGYLFEMFNGVLGNAARSTSNSNEEFLSNVADYYIEGVGLEEIKRSALYGDDLLKDLSFHLGQFSVGGVLARQTGDDQLRKNLGIAILDVIYGKNSTDPQEKIRERILKSFTTVVLDYLEWRIYNMPNTANKEYSGIFWFVTRHGPILGSEFIRGIIEYNKLYISGQAELVEKDADLDYRTKGFKNLLRLLLEVAGELKDVPSEDELRPYIKELINENVEKNTHSLISNLQFKLNYGNYGKE